MELVGMIMTFVLKNSIGLISGKLITELQK
jgi:hypothetical protein